MAESHTTSTTRPGTPAAPIAMVCALQSEAPRGLPGFVIAISGPGASNARRAAECVIGGRDLAGLLSVGYAGALDPRLAIGDIVIDTDVPEWRAFAGRRATTGRITTIDRVVRTAAERRELAAATGAVAVDMESAAVAEVARGNGLPFANIRAMTDSCARDLVLDWNALRRADGSFRTAALLIQALRTPRGIAEIRQLWYASRLASRKLSALLREWGEISAGHGTH